MLVEVWGRAVLCLTSKVRRQIRRKLHDCIKNIRRVERVVERRM